MRPGHLARTFMKRYFLRDLCISVVLFGSTDQVHHHILIEKKWYAYSKGIFMLRQ